VLAGVFMEKEIILVDCFNTIILRNASPNEVIFNFTKKLGDKFLVEPSALYKIFINEKNKLAVKSKLSTGEAEYCFLSAGGILDNFSKAANDVIKNISIEDFFESAKECYIEAEAESHCLNQQAVDILKQHKAKNGKVYVVSDFYCEKEIFAIWFKKLGILDLIDDIFVSCEFKCSKRTGKLYKKVLETLGCTADKCLMIGDNRKSDCLNAKKNGIDFMKINTKQLKDTKTFKTLKSKGVNFLEYEKIFEQDSDYNFSNFAFPLYLFTKRLYMELEKNNVKNIFFFAREGQFLKKLFDNYCEKTRKKSEIKTHYLMVSRNSLFLASLKPLGEEDFYYCLRDILYLTIKKFLITLNFDNDKIAQIQQELGVNINKKYHKLGKSGDFKKLLANQTFIDEYNKKRLSNSEAFVSYLNSFGVDIKNDGMTVVDVGWGGTIQDLLMKFLGESVRVHGYYVGARDKSEKDMANKTGLLYAPKKKTYRGHKMFHHHMAFYEQLLRADHNRVDGYTLKNGVGGGTFVLDTRVDDEKNYRMLIAPMQEKLSRKFDEICAIEKYEQCSLFEDYAIRAFYKMIKKPTKKDNEWLFKCEDTHFDNFVRIGYNFRLLKHGFRTFMYGFGNFIFSIKFCVSANRVSVKRAIKQNKLTKVQN
jgi:HAD superfamily hydrolase (TIGR01549 family)